MRLRRRASEPTRAPTVASLAIVRLLICAFRISCVRLDGDRVPSGKGKTKLLSAIEHARTSLKLTVVLRLIGLSPSAGQVTATEIRSMHDMATSPEHRHMSVRTLALHAQRLGRVFVSAGTWLRLIRERGWRRPRTRVPRQAQSTAYARRSRMSTGTST